MNLKAFADAYLGLIFKVGLAIVTLSTLFLFTNLTTESYETPKFIILLIFTGIFLLTITLKFTVLNKVEFTRTPFDLPLLLLLATAVVSSVLSPAPYVSLLGSQLKVSTSLIALITYVLFYFILTNSFKTLKDIRSFLNLAVISGAILSVLSLIAFFGITFLPKPWVQGLNFTPTGSAFATTAVLALLLPVLVSRIFSSGNLISKAINGALLTLFGITIVLTGVWATMIAAGVAVILSLLVNSSILKLEEFWKDVSLLLVAGSLSLTALAAALSFIPPLSGVQNPFYSQSRNFPREIQMPFTSSWKISVSAFRDSPFWGSGPSTYLFDFTQYKPIEFNQTKTWNIRFDSAFNQYMETLATLGGVGILALLSLTALFLTSAWKNLTRQEATGNRLQNALAVSILAFFIILALHPASLVVWVIGLTFLAAFSVSKLLENPSHITFGTSDSVRETFLKIISKTYSTQSISETITIEALPSILLTVGLGFVLFSFFFGGKLVVADFHHRKALDAVSQNNGVIAYNELIAAEKLNSVNDLYRTDLAQINFALANAIASAKGPTQASPSGSLTDQDKQNIQVLLQQSINEGRTATTLSPKSAIDWEILALLYRQIAGVAQNALLFSLDSYGKAIFADPLNPQLRLNVGGTYYAIKNYDLAIRFFTDAINLKPDFANGYYNLSVALRDKGDLNSALQMAQKVVDLVDKNSSDYKVATDYLNDLKAKVNPPTPANPPASETSGELQNEQLPKVVNVGNPPEKIATPGAVKKPNSTPEPTTQP